MNKKGIKKTIVLLLSISLIICGCSRAVHISSHVSFDAQTAYTHARTLSSAEYGGRLPGTLGNERAAAYIADAFKHMGLLGGGDGNTYFQHYKQLSIDYNGKPVVLEVVDASGKVVERFTYRRDYVETLLVSDPYDVTSAFGINSAEYGTPIIAYSAGRPTLAHAHVQLIERPIMGGGPAPGPTTIYLKSPHIRGKGQGMYITPSTLARLTEHQKKGHLIRAAASISFPEVTVMNVIGILPAKVPTLETFIISAHFDHLGTDPDGTVNFGAADNASGVGSMLALAESLTNGGNPYPFNIAFIAFNGEESGMLGSRHYAQTLPRKDDVVGAINLDMVGIRNATSLAIIRARTGARMLKAIRNTAKASGITTVAWEGSAGSDHLPFSEVGIEAVTLLHYSQHHFDHYYHVPADTIETLSLSKLQEVGEITLHYLAQLAAKRTPRRLSSIRSAIAS